MEHKKSDVYEYNGYNITKDGTVKNQNGKIMSVSDGKISLTIHGKKYRRLAGRVVWAAVNGRELTAKEILLYKDGNKDNISYDNLEVLQRKEYFSGCEWPTIRKFNKEKQKEILSRAGNLSVPELAAEYKCCEQTIRKVLNGTY